jgi:hypothetical protein
MVAKIINVWHHFLSVVKSFSWEKAHNMVISMLDPHFKGMDCIGKDQATILLQQYDFVSCDAFVESCDGIFESISSCMFGYSIIRATFDFKRVVWANNFNTKGN